MSNSATPGVKKYSLKNGLTVVMQCLNHAPVVSLNVGVKVGSAWETDDEAGLSHLLEHMVFKGTKSYQPGEIASLVEASGGDLNAYTSFDQTVYYINLSSRYWKRGLNLIKEMVFDAIIDDVELEREKEVVVEEINRGQDNPHSQLSELLFSTAYQKHTYGRPVIGYEKNVRSFSPEFVQNYYKKWYTPQNMILAVCGDFNVDEMQQAIEQEFGGYQPTSLIRHELPLEPYSQSPKFVKKSMAIEGNYASLAFPITNFKHKDTPALDLLSHILGDGETSRLHHHIKEQKGLVNSIQSFAYTPYSSGLFIIDVNVTDKNINTVWPAILNEIEVVRNRLIPSTDIIRAKINIKSSIYYSKETCEGTAKKWITYETIADNFDYESEYLKQIELITAEDIKRVANEYLNLNQSTLAVLSSKKNKRKIYPITQYIKSKVALKKSYELISQDKDVFKYKLKNGLSLILKENHRLPLISMRFASLGGLRYENKKNNGITSLMTSLLEKETQSKTPLEIAQISEEMAGHISASAGRNSWGISSSFISEKKQLGINLFLDVLLNPGFSASEFKKEKILALEAIKNQQDSPSHLAFKLFQEKLFLKHPYGMPVTGSEKTVKSLNLEAVKKYYQSILNPKQMSLCVVGDFDSESLLLDLVDSLLKIKPGIKKWKNLASEKPALKTQKISLNIKKMQSHIVLGFLGPTIKSKDRFALDVLNNVLSGQGGRLFLELRDKQSLAYSVTSTLSQGIEPGFFATYIGCDSSKVNQAIDGIQIELNKVVSQKISEEELKRAQNFIVGNYEIDLQRNSTIAATIALNDLYGFSLTEMSDYPKNILDVTCDDVLKAAQKYIKLKAYTLSVVGPN